jgi:CRP-like cAMP-binding protein
MDTPMPRQRDAETGRYDETYPPETFVEAIADLGASSTTEIAEHVGCDRRTAYVKLTGLRDDGEVSSRKVGQTLLWSLDR